MTDDRRKDAAEEEAAPKERKDFPRQNIPNS